MKRSRLNMTKLATGLLLLACASTYAGASSAASATSAGASTAASTTANITVKAQLKLSAASALDVKNVKILAASRAGKRIVAVGDFGAVLLSDDEGTRYRQAKSVPIAATLTSVFFADAQTGWAVGHWGAILKTTDGGESWQLQRSAMERDQPLFSVYFADAKQGWAVGLWSLMLHTTDGGANWVTQALPAPPGGKKADRNLFALFGDAQGRLFITSEQGRVLRSQDKGVTWEYRATGYAGSFWSGTAVDDGSLLVGGLSGTIYRSKDGGYTWQAISSGTKSAITGMLQRANKNIVAVGLNGVVLESRDQGSSFSVSQRPDRAVLTALVDSPASGQISGGPANGAPHLFSTRGPVQK